MAVNWQFYQFTAILLSKVLFSKMQYYSNNNVTKKNNKGVCIIKFHIEMEFNFANEKNNKIREYSSILCAEENRLCYNVFETRRTIEEYYINRYYWEIIGGIT